MQRHDEEEEEGPEDESDEAVRGRDESKGSSEYLRESLSRGRGQQEEENEGEEEGMGQDQERECPREPRAEQMQARSWWWRRGLEEGIAGEENKGTGKTGQREYNRGSYAEEVDEVEVVHVVPKLRGPVSSTSPSTSLRHSQSV
eukprot:747364-Hanusia_phi.AAC.8